MARTHTFTKSTKLASALRNINEVSRFLALQLEEMGYINIVRIHNGKRGRPVHEYVLTGKGRGYVALSLNWGKKTMNLRQFRNVQPMALAA